MNRNKKTPLDLKHMKVIAAGAEKKIEEDLLQQEHNGESSNKMAKLNQCQTAEMKFTIPNMQTNMNIIEQVNKFEI